MNFEKNPLTPHLQIYKWHISSLLSIAHRIVGVVNFFVLILICLWIFSFNINENIFNIVVNLLTTNFGKFLILDVMHLLFPNFHTNREYFFINSRKKCSAQLVPHFFMTAAFHFACCKRFWDLWKMLQIRVIWFHYTFVYANSCKYCLTYPLRDLLRRFLHDAWATTVLLSLCCRTSDRESWSQ